MNKTETEFDLVEADYCATELQQMQDHTVMLGGKEIEIPVVSIDCGQQALFIDADALELMHPKLRRMIKVQLKVKDTSAAARAAQKKVEKDKVSQALNCLQAEWKIYLASALVKTSRAEILSQLQPGVVGKHKKMLAKSKLKIVQLLVVITRSS